MGKLMRGMSLCVLVLAMVYMSNELADISAFYSEEPHEENTVVCRATIDDDFVDNKVMVVIKNSYSLKFKSYSADDLADVGCSSVEDLSTATARK